MEIDIFKKKILLSDKSTEEMVSENFRVFFAQHQQQRDNYYNFNFKHQESSLP